MSVRLERQRSDGSIVDVVITNTSDGDFHIDAESDALNERRRAVLDGDWVVVRQVHGADVVDAASVLEAGLGAEFAPDGDALLTDLAGVPIAVQGADCAPLAFVTDRGPIAVAHAGWRGLAAGVIASAVDALRARGARVSEVLVGPLIGVGCYEFGESDLEHVAGQLGDVVRGVTTEGTPALDLQAAIVASCEAAGIADVQFVGTCTACDGGGFSHRARKEGERHALVARIRR